MRLNVISEKEILSNSNNSIERLNIPLNDSSNSLVQEYVPRTSKQIEEYDKPIKESPFQLGDFKGLAEKPIKVIITKLLIASISVRPPLGKILKEHIDSYNNNAGIRANEQNAIDRMENRELMDKINNTETKFA